MEQKSYLQWMFEALGPFYGLVLPLTGFAVFVGACLVVILSRRTKVIAAYLVFLPLPVMIGLFGSLQGMLASFSVIAAAGTTPKASEWALGISSALFTTFLGLLVTFPSYFVVACGLFYKTLTDREPRA